MARQSYAELYEQDTIDIADKYLVVDTRRAGYNGQSGNVFRGTQTFRVVKEGEDYLVYPTDWKQDEVGVLVNAKYPIILTVGGEDVFFTDHTIHDPYNHATPRQVVDNGQSIEHKVLDAFSAFVQTEYRFGGPVPYNTVLFLADGVTSPIYLQDDSEQNEIPIRFERLDLDGAPYIDPEVEQVTEGNGTEDLMP